MATAVLVRAAALTLGAVARIFAPSSRIWLSRQPGFDPSIEKALRRP